MTSVKHSVKKCYIKYYKLMPAEWYVWNIYYLCMKMLHSNFTVLLQTARFTQALGSIVVIYIMRNKCPWKQKKFCSALINEVSHNCYGNRNKYTVPIHSIHSSVNTRFETVFILYIYSPDCARSFNSQPQSREKYFTYNIWRIPK